jgi:hypothetical protein
LSTRPAQGCYKLIRRRPLAIHAIRHTAYAYTERIAIAQKSEVYIVGIERFTMPVRRFA